MSNRYVETSQMQVKSRIHPKAKVEVVKLGNIDAFKLALEPGRKW